MWGGFSTSALSYLRRKADLHLESPTERGEAAWHLARWHFFQRDYEHALKYLEFVRELNGETQPTKGEILLESLCLLRLNDPVAARTRLDRTLASLKGSSKRHVDYFLAYANTYAPFVQSTKGHEDRLRLQWINLAFAAHELAGLTKTDPSRSLGIDNIKAELAAIKAERAAHSAESS